MKTCQNPSHGELNPQVAKFVLSKFPWGTWLKDEPRFLCEACAWVWENLGHLDREHYSIDEIEEWEEEQLTEEEKRQRDRDDYHDREYHRMKDEGLI